MKADKTMSELCIQDQFLVKTEDQLREQFGETTESIWAKATDSLSAPMTKFISLSPFCCISSCDSQGQTDISPRGDAPGFISIANPRQLILPDRPGNRRFDTIRNIMQNPQVSLLFMIPGCPLTVRVNGQAQISYDPALLGQFEVQQKLPKMVLIITVQEAYGHCAKAINRGKLWSPDYRQSRTDVPSLTELMTHHLELQKEEINRIESTVVQDLKDSMY